MKFKLQSEGVKPSDIKTLEQRLFLVRLSRNLDDIGRLGFIEGAKFALDNRKNMTIDSFKKTLQRCIKEIRK